MHVDHPLVKKDKLKLRRYQEAVVARALGDNTLVVLPTGLGKTIIAAMVAAGRLSEHKGCKVLFLAPTKPLAVQHKRSFEDVLEVGETAVLTGAEKPGKRQAIWDDASIIFATPQTISNDILRGLSFSDVCLMIFDEAHRAVGDYAYVHIANHYLSQGKDQLTLGLTASPSSDREKVEEICANLGIRQVEAKTEKDTDVREYVQDVDVKWVKVTLPRDQAELRDRLQKAYKGELEKLKEMGYTRTQDPNRMNKRALLAIQARVRAEIAEGKASFHAASVAAAAFKVGHAVELIETQGVSATSEYLSRLRKQKSKAVKSLLANTDIAFAFEEARRLLAEGTEHPKVSKAVQIARAHKGGKVLLFTQYRDSAETLVKALKKAGVAAHEFIGQASRGKMKGMTQKRQVEVLDSFRSGGVEVLVATSVAEEGLDIPKVDAVIFYEPVPSEIRTIQRRGRTGRQSTGKVYILLTKGTRDEGYFWSAWRKEKRMGELVDDLGREKRSSPQTKLDATPIQEKEVTVFVDSRERNHGVLTDLNAQANIEFANLQVGDYLVSDRVCIERKTVSDMANSIVDKRLLTQLGEMRRNFEIPVLIIEGSESVYAQRNIHPNAVRGAIASAAVDFGARIIYTVDGRDTAGIILAFARREQLDNRRPVGLRGDRKPELLTEKQRYVVESLPNVSAVLAERLLAAFGTVEGVMSAEKPELTKVEGIGEKKADAIVKVTHSRYGNGLM